MTATGIHDWYKDAVIYQLHVRSFADSNGDGTGDFDGLTEHLDYLVDLGVNTAWLLPFFPSPLRDDGYDIADYNSINPAYGDMASFRRFLKAAHARDLRVVIELVMNHTSDQHPWFQRARTSPPGSRYRNFYVWSDDPDKYSQARVIFQDFETSNWTWDPVAQQYYWHRFYSHQPDLNFESPDVRRAMFATLDKWFRLGVDAARLDAVPYLFEEEGTNCENLPKTHEFLRDLRTHLDTKFPGRMLLAEANQWPEDAVTYFGNDDECHMAFHFPLMPRLFMAVQMESRTPVVDILQQTPDIPPSSQWAMFLRNHDELTLEMVTDEERDYMYRRFAGDPQMRVNLGIRRRLSPLLHDDRRMIQLLNGLLFSLPGTPVVYYGDEIGMGDNVYLGDRDAVRTPMQWSADRNAGFSRCNPHQLFLPVIVDPAHHYEAVNVEAQQRNPSSLWWWMRRLITLRQRHPVFARGEMVMLDSDNSKVLTFLRRDLEHPGDDMVVVANFSRHAQQVTLRLADYDGVRPVELFGQTTFDAITADGWSITIGAHDFYWLRLPTHAATGERPVGPVPQVTLGERGAPLDRAARASLAKALPRHVLQQRWFGNHDRAIADVDISASMSIRSTGGLAIIAQVDFTTAEPQRYFMPVIAQRTHDDAGDEIGTVASTPDSAVIGTLSPGWRLVDATTDTAVISRLVRLIYSGEAIAGGGGSIRGEPFGPKRRLKPAGPDGSSTIRPLGAEQSNTSCVVDEQAVFKVLRRVATGIHPEPEMLGALNASGFTAVPTLHGTLVHRPVDGGAATTVATLVGYVPSDGDLWTVLRADSSRFYESAIAGAVVTGMPDLLSRPDTTDELPEPLVEMIDRVQLLGVRTAELHLALAGAPGNRFRPEPFTRLYQRSLYQGMRTDVISLLDTLRKSVHHGTIAGIDKLVATGEEPLLARLAPLTDHLFECDRIRIHGDLHLAQVLQRGGDFTFIDFEGEPSRPIGERSIKRSCLADVAGMIRSFDYAASQGALDALERGIAAEAELQPWAIVWNQWASSVFVTAYLETVDGSRVVPAGGDDVRDLLDAFLLQKAMYEVRYELGSRPTWAWVPIRALLDILATDLVSSRSGHSGHGSEV